jgi:predicted RNase H-like nuclease (RuvC/YqgF family)
MQSNDSESMQANEDGILLKAIRARADGEYKIANVETAARVFKRDARFLLDRLDQATATRDSFFEQAKELEKGWREAKADNIALRSRLEQIQSEKMMQFRFRKECEARIFVLENDLKDAQSERDSLRKELELVKRLSGELEHLTIKFHNAIHSTLT